MCLSATIDISLFKTYFNNCSLIEIEGKNYDVKEYFLEDIIQLVNFRLNSFNTKKQTNRNKQIQQDDDDEQDLFEYEDSQDEHNQVFFLLNLNFDF